MTINRTAYTTTACQGHVTSKIEEKLQIANVRGDITRVANTNDQLLGLASPMGNASDVPAFWHPLIFAPRGSKEEKIIVDDRQYVKFSANDHRPHATNQTEYELLLRRGRINAVWIYRPATYLRDLSTVPAKAYVSWVTESIQRVMALDPAEQMRLSILVAIFYYSQFDNAIQLSEHDWNKLATRVADITRTRVDEVFSIVDKLESKLIPNLAAFCDVAADAVESVRLKDLNPGLVFGCIGGGWFGTNVREMLGVALEHPPTWFAIVLTAIENRSYHRTTIANIVLRQKQTEQFTVALSHLVASVSTDTE